MQKRSVSSLLAVSIVIPAYNEEKHIAACLDSIAAQTTAPYEVIVVDNNSSDATVAIASRYSFVTVLHESRQGIAFARDCGFNAARGDVLGRIDADTLIEPDWVEQLQRIFTDSAVTAVSGSVSFNDVPFAPALSRIDWALRHYLARNLTRIGELFLFGGNMAMRASLWRSIRGGLCRNSEYHEDMDLAAHIAHSQHRIGFDDRLRASVSVRRIDTPFRNYCTYVVANSRTYAAHGLKGRFYMWPVEAFVIAIHGPARLLYRSYDPATGSMSLKRMFRSATTPRTSPISESV
jgi:glycosyltransferase involved in cell wall biosynthesis